MKVTITLTPAEIMLGATAGMMRQVENIKNNARPFYGAGRDNDWQLNIEGVLGEMALSKHLGIYWKGKGTMRAPDVGDVDVRTTAHEGGHLILHPNDPDDRLFYLLTGKNGTYTLHGSILGRAGKLDKWVKDPTGGRPAYFVPQEALKPPYD